MLIWIRVFKTVCGRVKLQVHFHGHFGVPLCGQHAVGTQQTFTNAEPLRVSDLENSWAD